MTDLVQVKADLTTRTGTATELFFRTLATQLLELVEDEHEENLRYQALTIKLQNRLESIRLITK